MLIRLLSAGFIHSCLLASPITAEAQEMEELKTYCMSDIKRLCKGIEPGGGRILQCLKANKKGMSVGCAQALQSLKLRSSRLLDAGKGQTGPFRRVLLRVRLPRFAPAICRQAQ